MTDTMTQTLHSQLDLTLMSPELSVALAKSSVLLSSLLILGPGHPSHRPWTHGCQLPQKEPSALPLPPAVYYVLKPEPGLILGLLQPRLPSLCHQDRIGMQIAQVRTNYSLIDFQQVSQPLFSSRPPEEGVEPA